MVFSSIEYYHGTYTCVGMVPMVHVYHWYTCTYVHVYSTYTCTYILASTRIAVAPY
jgi:hypothetical protein